MCVRLQICHEWEGINEQTLPFEIQKLIFIVFFLLKKCIKHKSRLCEFSWKGTQLATW